MKRPRPEAKQQIPPQRTEQASATIEMTQSVGSGWFAKWSAEIGKVWRENHLILLSSSLCRIIANWMHRREPVEDVDQLSDEQV